MIFSIFNRVIAHVQKTEKGKLSKFGFWLILIQSQKKRNQAKMERTKKL